MAKSKFSEVVGATMVKIDGCELFQASEREHYLGTHFGATWSQLMDVSFSLLFEASEREHLATHLAAGAT